MAISLQLAACLSLRLREHHDEQKFDARRLWALTLFSTEAWKKRSAGCVAGTMQLLGPCCLGGFNDSLFYMPLVVDFFQMGCNNHLAVGQNHVSI